MKLVLTVPKVILQGPRSYKVRYNPDLVRDQDYLGTHSTRHEHIEIDPMNGEQDKFVTLMHEEIHAINVQYSLKFDEETIDRLAHGFSEFLIRNFGISFDWSGIK